MRMSIGKIFPISHSLKGYQGRDFTRDLNAGLTVGVILIPQAMAYAMLAGLPPIYGLYAGLLPLVIYALLGTTRQLSVGPVAVSSLLVLAGISTIAEPFSARYIELALLTGVLAGVLQLLLGLLRMGFLVNFLSRPVIAGFSSAAAIIIAISQLKDVLGFSISGTTTADSLIYAITHLGETHTLTCAIALVSLVILLICRTISRKIPSSLIVAILATLLCYYFRWDQSGAAIIGDIPSGLPSFSLGSWSANDLNIILPTVFTVGIIGSVECLSIAKVLESRTKDHIVQPNQELMAMGLSKIVGGFFQAMPSSSSFSRSAINNERNAHSQVSSIITAIIVLLTLLFFTDLFYYMPKAVLAAIILQSVIGLFEWKEAKHLWKVHKSDLTMMLITFLITLVLGIEKGVFLGVLMSILMVLYKSTKPHVAELGNIPGTPFYRNINRFEESTTSDNILIIRFDDQLYYGNASFFKEYIRGEVEGRANKLTHLLLDCSNIHNMDSTGTHALLDIEEYLASHEIEIHLAAERGPVRDMLTVCGMMKEPLKHHMSVHAGVTAIKANEGR